MNTDFDLLVAGSGFGGSLMAMAAASLGLRVLLVERGAHPRFAIGESTSPLANLLLEEMAEQYDLGFLKPLAAYGSWQRACPQLACGLKRGFTFFRHAKGERFSPSHPEASLMVAASPNSEVADTHWFRAGFDTFLVEQVRRRGIEYLDRTEVGALEQRPQGGWRIALQGREGEQAVTARFLIDATGPRGLLFRRFALEQQGFPALHDTQALYSHFQNVARCEDLPDFALPGSAPYPMDDAALHHVFEGGWAWALRFNNGITSAGAALEPWLAAEIGLPGDRQAAWQNLLARFPSMQAQFAEAAAVQPFQHIPAIPFCTSRAAGEGWAMLPSASSSIDALFSTGIPLTLLGIQRLAALLAREGTRPSEEGLRHYEQATLEEAQHTARYVAACRRSMGNFPLFSELTMFYFAAASYSEMARRLQKPHLVKRYLAADRADFCDGLARCEEMLKTAPCPARFAETVRQSLAPMNIAGLCDPAKQGRYGVDLQDLVRGASLLEMSPEAMAQLLAIAPWAQQAA